MRSMVLLPLVVVGCRADPLDRYLQPWVCPGNPSGPDIDVDGDGQVTDRDLQPGQSAVRMRWLDPPSDALVVSVRTDSDAEENPFFDEETWGIWHRIGCEDEAGLHLWFPAKALGTTAPIALMSIDIPTLEQGSAPQPQEDAVYNARVVLDASTDDGLTGYLDGSVELPLYSHITREYLGQRIRIEAYAFSAVPW